MKRSYTLSLLFFLSVVGQAQLVQGRLKPGSSPNSVIVCLKSNATFTGQITNVQFVLEVPIAATPIPSAVIKNNPLAAAIPTGNYLNLTSVESGFRNYLFAATTLGSPTTTFTSGVEMDALEVQFNNGPTAPNNEVRMAQIPNGGASSQMNFYIEVGGIDRTNETAMFYGTGATNSALGYAGYSFSSLSNIALPVNWLSFSAVKQGSDVQLNWEVNNENDVDHYVLEAGINGSDFAALVSVAKLPAPGNKTYSRLDLQVARYNSKILYYRIKEFDLNGRFTYSPIRSIRLDVKGETTLYPNPAKEGFTLSIPYTNQDQKTIQLQLVNKLGQVMEKREITRLAASNYYYSVQSSAIASGEYLLKIYDDGLLTETKRLVIAK